MIVGYLTNENKKTVRKKHKNDHIFLLENSDKVLDNNNINSISIMNLNSHKAWIEIKDYTIIVFGLVLYAFGWTSFLLTNEITTGGIAGVSALIFFGTKIPVAISYFTLNALLLIAAIRILGIQFCIRTIFSVIVMTLLLSFFGMYIKEPLITGEPFMSCIIGGILCGAGIGIVFTHNGSTGGTDIIAAMINKYKEIFCIATFLSYRPLTYFSIASKKLFSGS